MSEVKNDYSKNENLNNILIFVVLFLFSSYFLRLSFLNLVGFVTDEFVSLELQLPKTIIYLMPTVFMMAFFKNLFYKKFSKTGAIVFISITTVVLGVALGFLIANIDVQLSNFTKGYYNKFSPFDLFLICGILLGVNIIILFKIIQGKFSKEYRDPINPGVFNIYTAKRLIFILIIGFFASYYFADFLLGITLFDYFALYPIEYSYLLLFIVLPFVSLILYLNINPIKKGTRVAYFVIGVVDLLVACGLELMLQFDPDLIASTVGQPLFLLTYASSIPISYYFVMLVLIVIFVDSLINFVKIFKTEK